MKPIHTFSNQGLVLLFSFGLSGCAVTQIRLEPDSSYEQNIAYHQGNKIITSVGKNVVVLRLLTETLFKTQRAEVVTIFLNVSEEPVEFSTENINITASGESLKIFTYDELLREIQAAQSSQALAATLLGISNMINAQQSAYSYHSGTANAYINGPGGGWVYGTYSGYTYDPAAAAIAQSLAQSQMNSDLQQINNSAMQQIENLENTILRKQTVMGYSWHGGVVKFMMPKVKKDIPSVPITINVDVDGDNHEFHFIASRIK